MSIIDWAHDRSEHATLWDIGVLKVSAMVLGMIVGAYAAPFVTRNIWWFIAALVVLGARGSYRWFAAKPTGVRAATAR